MKIADCKTVSCLACAVSSLLLGAVPISTCQAQNVAQLSAPKPATSAVVIPTTTTPDALDATTLLLKDIEASVYRDRTISDDDLAFVLKFARTPGVDQLTAYHALAPLSILWTRRISDSQYATIHKFVLETLQSDDKLTDPSGLQKVECLSILFHYSREKSMRPLVESLRNDSRRNVSKEAEMLSDNHWWDKLKD